jgi:hypothetical protein
VTVRKPTHPLVVDEHEPDAIEAAEELPVVARLVVEIRSDGSRTIARGALEDNLGGQRVGVEARADSPLELSRALAKMVLSAPFAALLGRSTSDGSPDRGPTVRGTIGALGRRLLRIDRGSED